MGALQAQDYQQGLWAIGLRTHGSTLADVERAIATGTIVRTWALRGTLHFVLAQDVGWMMALTSARQVTKDAARLRQLGLHPDDLERSRDLMSKALRRHSRLPRPKLMEILDLAGISTEGQRGYHILWHAAQSGLVCMGPMEGKQHTFVLLDEWVKQPRVLSTSDALCELATRYFLSHGPATANDLAWWAGLTLTEARAAVESAKPSLVQTDLDGVSYYSGPAPTGDAIDTHLLAGFDEYLLGYNDRQAVLDDAHAEKVVPGGNGVFFPTMLRQGRVVGTWKRKLTKASIELRLSPFEPMNDAPDIFAPAALRYTEFLGLKPSDIALDENGLAQVGLHHTE